MSSSGGSAGGGGGVTDHGALTGLNDDDHAQYATDARVDAVQATIVTDHGGLGGLADPDHPIAAVAGLQAALDAKIAAAVLDAHTVLGADVDNTPLAIAVAVKQVLGRLSAGGLVGIPFARLNPAPVESRSTVALSMQAAVANTWQDAEATGTAAARPADVVLPGPFEAGDWIEGWISGRSAAATVITYMDLWTIVASAAVSHFGPASLDLGPSNWHLTSAVEEKASSTHHMQLVAGDIEGDGSVRLRLRFRQQLTTIARILSGSTTHEWRVGGRGPLG